jgi:hypothetical protein
VFAPSSFLSSIVLSTVALGREEEILLPDGVEDCDIVGE